MRIIALLAAALETKTQKQNLRIFYFLASVLRALGNFGDII